jgi:hypothetical protein
MPSVAVPTGAQVLRITYAGRCAAFESRAIVPIVYTRVVVTRAGAGWIAAAGSPAAGDLELRFQPTGASTIAGSMPIQGTIKGVAIHAPDILPSLPAIDTRANFGTDNGTTVSGFAFTVSAISPTGGVGGIGTGTISVSNSTGDTCAGSSFSWGLGPPG